MLLLRAPEVNLPSIAPESVTLQAFGEEQIFPKRALVFSLAGSGVKVLQKRIADAVVAKIDLLPSFSSAVGFLDQEGTTFTMKQAASKST